MRVSLQSVMGVGGDPVMTLSWLGRRIDVDGDISCMGHMVQDLMAHFLGYRVTLDHGKVRAHHDVDFEGEPMADPSAAHLGHVVDP